MCKYFFDIFHLNKPKTEMRIYHPLFWEYSSSCLKIQENHSIWSLQSFVHFYVNLLVNFVSFWLNVLCNLEAKMHNQTNQSRWIMCVCGFRLHKKHELQRRIILVVSKNVNQFWWIITLKRLFLHVPDSPNKYVAIYILILYNMYLIICTHRRQNKKNRRRMYVRFQFTLNLTSLGK